MSASSAVAVDYGDPDHRIERIEPVDRAGRAEPGGRLSGRDAAVSADRGELVRELQSRIRSMQRIRLDTRALPTNPALADLLPGGGLTAGGAYAVQDSSTLALALLQGPSAAGAWCAVVGMPDLGVEAAAGLGIDLERLVLVPYPGEQWLAVVSALIDVVSVVLVRPPSRAGRPRVGDAVAGRLASRLRQRETALVALGDWPRADARLTVTENRWAGIGTGYGHLSARELTVASKAAEWSGRERSRRLQLTGSGQLVEVVDAPPVLHRFSGRELSTVMPGQGVVG